MQLLKTIRSTKWMEDTFEMRFISSCWHVRIWNIFSHPISPVAPSQKSISSCIKPQCLKLSKQTQQWRNFPLGLFIICFKTELFEYQKLSFPNLKRETVVLFCFTTCTRDADLKNILQILMACWKIIFILQNDDSCHILLIGRVSMRSRMDLTSFENIIQNERVRSMYSFCEFPGAHS